MARSVVVRVPATSANLGPGFDCLGLALDLWGSVHLEAHDRPVPPPKEPIALLAVEAALHLFHHLGAHPPRGIYACYEGSVPVARGLGASAIARVGGLLAANALAGHPLDKEDILLLATEMEGHADNAAPAIFGGLQIVARRDDGGIVHMGLEPPPGLRVVLFVPQQELPTALARQAVPPSIPRADAVYSLARVALLVAALATGRLEHLAEASDDRIHQPYRARLFPPLRPLLEAAMKAGALGAYLSGAGPTVAAFALEDAERVAQALDDMAARMGLAGRTILTSPTTVGAHLAEESP